MLATLPKKKGYHLQRLLIADASPGRALAQVQAFRLIVFLMPASLRLRGPRGMAFALASAVDASLMIKQGT